MSKLNVSKRQWLIIGSVAMNHWYDDYREPQDIDLLTPIRFIGSKSDICVIETQWHSFAQEIIDQNEHPIFADPDLLFTLKVSHAEWDIKWNKTMADIEFMKRKGCQLKEDLYVRLVEHWKIIHGKKRVNLKQPVDIFFQDYVQREYDHEDLHRLVAFNGTPMHEQLRPDNTSVWCDKEKFFALDYEIQCEVALEEILVTAIERKKLTSVSRNSEIMAAIHHAYHKLVTSMTTGWFAKFLILNRFELLKERREKWEHHLKTTLLNLPTLTPLVNANG